MDPTGFILATRVAHHDTHSARPDAPVIASKPRRPSHPPRINSVRRAAAASLRNLAARIEPHRGSEPCRPATP
jgi:hypothetical protein